VLAALGLVLATGIVLTGVVLDPSGAPAPGALVTLHGPDRRTLTDYRGAFRFEDVSPGRYEIEVRAEHFKPTRLRVNVTERGMRPLRIILELAALHETLTVRDAALRLGASPGENPDVVRLDLGLLKGLPVLDQDVLAAAALFLNPAEIGAGGYGLIVDGMETDRLGATASAIREVRINQNPYSAEFSSPGRGRLEVTTARGETAYHGELNLLVRDHRLDARNAFALERPRQQRRTLEGHLTGPLGRSRRLSFLMSAQRQADDQESIVYALTPAGLLRQQAPRPERDSELNFRLNYQPDDRHWLAWRYERESDSTRGDDIGGFDLPEVGTDSRDREQAAYFSLQVVHSPRWLHQLQARLRTEREHQASRTPGVPKVAVEGAFTGGGGQTERLQRRLRGEFTDVWSWSSTRHLVKVGAGLREADRTDFRDLSNRQGTFHFSSLEDFAARRPFSFVRQTGEGRVLLWSAAGAAFLQDDFRFRPKLSLGLGLRYERFAYPGDANNLAPRLSLAWAPGRRPNTLLRAGAGIFYDRLGSGAVRDAHLLDGVRLRRLLLVNPGYPDPFAGEAASVLEPASLVRLAGNLRAPYLIHYGLGISRQLAAKTTFSLNYTGLRGLKQFRSLDLNAPQPPDYVRPDPALAAVRSIESSARLTGHSLEVGLRGNLSKFFDGALLYTLGRTFNDTDGPDQLPADSRDLSLEWARANFDRRHRFHLFGKLSAPELFELGVILRLESGAPYSLTAGRDLNRDGSARDRPAGVPRNSLQGPGLAVLDLRWSRSFKPHEKAEVTFGLDAFNALNRVNYTSFVGNLSSPFFGRPVAARAARRLQLGLRVEF